METITNTLNMNVTDTKTEIRIHRKFPTQLSVVFLNIYTCSLYHFVGSELRSCMNIQYEELNMQTHILCSMTGSQLYCITMSINI